MEESEVSSVDDASDSYSSEEELSDEAELGSLASRFSDADQPGLSPTSRRRSWNTPRVRSHKWPKKSLAEPAEEPQATPSPSLPKSPNSPLTLSVRNRRSKYHSGNSRWTPRGVASPSGRLSLGVRLEHHGQ